MPDIDDVAVKYKNLGLNGFEVIADFLGVTAEGAEMKVAEDANLYRSFLGVHVRAKYPLVCWVIALKLMFLCCDVVRGIFRILPLCFPFC